MSAQTLTNAKLWVAGFDWSGDMNALALKYGAELQDKTNFASGGFHERLPGLQFFSFNHEGYWSDGVNAIDDAIFNTVFAAKNTVMTFDPSNAAAEGDICYTGQIDVANYAPGAKVGEVLKFSVSGDSDGDPLVRGTLMASRTVTASGNGPINQLGAVAAGKKVYAALHVLQGVSGTTPTLAVKVQSAAAVGFASPTDRITFSSANAPGAQWGSAAGAITDQFWRVNFTVGGTTPSFPFVVVVGIR